MIKRDTIQRCVIVTINDEMGGNSSIKELKEILPAHVSQNTTIAQMNQYGITGQIVLNVVTDKKLDEYVNARYIYSGKLFKIMRQVKSGNEFFSVLVEVNE